MWSLLFSHVPLIARGQVITNISLLGQWDLNNFIASARSRAGDLHFSCMLLLITPCFQLFDSFLQLQLLFALHSNSSQQFLLLSFSSCSLARGVFFSELFCPFEMCSRTLIISGRTACVLDLPQLLSHSLFLVSGISHLLETSCQLVYL